MWVQAAVTRDEFAQAFEDFCPAHVELDEGRWIDLARPSKVELLAERGIRVVSEARILWTVIGIDVPIKVNEAELFLAPKIAERADGKQVLRFDVTVGALDLQYVPHLLDAGIAARINDALAVSPLEWDFMKTLDFSFALPAQVSPADGVRLHAKWGEVKVAEDAISLAVSFAADVSRKRSVRAA